MSEKKDLRVYYLMNGQILFSEHIGINEDTGDVILRRPVMVMLGEQKQLGMSTAYPFTDVDANIQLNRNQITTSGSLDWNPQFMTEYDKFWDALMERVMAERSGIQIVPAGGSGIVPGGSRRVL
jgi:hypothetical protein